MVSASFPRARDVFQQLQITEHTSWCFESPDSLVAKDRLPDACSIFTGRVAGKSIPSLWKDRHPAIKGLQLQELRWAFHPDQKDSSESKTAQITRYKSKTAQITSNDTPG